MPPGQNDEQLINDLLDAVQPTQWTRISELANLFAAQHDAAGQWAPITTNDQGVTTLPFFDWSTELEELVELLYECQIVAPVDWVEWANDNGNLDDYDIGTAPPTDLVRYVTSVARADRFNEGTLAEYVKTGDFPAALLRLAELAS